ncbi:hypothetical protein V6N13_124942 [Hibiscus sabdariffa]
MSGHWKRNCPVYLEEDKKARAVGASVSGIYVIDVNMSTSSSWVLDTGCGSHICTSVQGLHMRRNLAKGDVDLRVGNGARVAALSMSTKLEPKSHKCTFVGYPKETKGQYFYNHKENKVFVARTGVFLEKDFLSSKEDRRNIELEEVQQQVTEPEVEQTSQVVEENLTDLETQPLQRSTREHHEPERYGFLVTTHGDIILVDHDEPKTYQEAVSSPDFEKWLEGLRSEMDSMSDNQQASRSWNLRFNDAIKEFGFIRNEDEPCVYKKFSGSIVSFLILYVDDILIIGNDIPTLQSVKEWLSSCFSMKDLGEAAYILGVKIYRDRSRRLLGLSHSTYIDKVLKRFNMEASKKGFLPMTHGISLSKEMCPSTSQESERMSQIPYASAIGSIMYAMICTRPDLSYALSMTSRY